MQIRGVMYSKLSGEDDYFRVKSIQKTSCDPDSRIEKFLDDRYRAGSVFFVLILD